MLHAFVGNTPSCEVFLSSCCVPGEQGGKTPGLGILSPAVGDNIPLVSPRGIISPLRGIGDTEEGYPKRLAHRPPIECLYHWFVDPRSNVFINNP